MAERRNLDLAAIRARLDGARGQDYWRGLEELADTEEFREAVHREFPDGASEWLDPVSRRQFLNLMGASIALAGLSGCTRQPREAIVPYVEQPEHVIPGKPLFFASAVTLRGYADGVIVESHEGRPTKIEGNPDHPASLGATDVFAQASVLDLYDPDRAQALTNAGRIRPWSTFRDSVRAAIEAQRGTKGARLRILTETVTSPTLARQLRAMLDQFPEAKWTQYEPAGRDGVREGARLAFGEVVETQYRFDKAKVILSLDADFVMSLPGHLRYVRDFVSSRRVSAEEGDSNRLYVVESAPTPTGAIADHRLALRPSEVEAFAVAAASRLGVGVKGEGAFGKGENAKWIEAVVRDLKQNAGTSLVVAGEEQPAVVHALAHAMNQALGNVGKTVVHTDPVEAAPQNQLESLKALVGEMGGGAVDLLLMIGGNPVFSAPADLEFAKNLDKVPLRVYWGAYPDETAELCHWHVPAAHALESWSDARAYDGTVTIVQPLIEPLYEGRSMHELVETLFGREGEKPSHDIVRETHTRGLDKAAADKVWRKALHDGVMANTALSPKSVSLRSDWVSRVTVQTTAKEALEIAFRPDPTIFDGRFANNGWLQELPKPLSKLTWDNVAMISPATAERLGLQNEMLVTLKLDGRSVDAPVWIQPGQANECVTVHLGYGRWRTGRVGAGAGFNAYALRSTKAPWGAAGLEVLKTNGHVMLASTQVQQSMEGRPMALAASLAEFRKDPEFAKKLVHDPPPGMSMYDPPVVYDGYAWGMAIDLSASVGCNACTIACQAENNISVVGKDQVDRGRVMHWIRVDRYFKGSMDAPEMYLQPVPCMHCENAPCEVVCPVGATTHSAEGLNDMVYNRCVGTRYCSNNCPYKVRRFNFYLFADFATESLKGARNPNVTVRSRGVMEKCTYCVQRINAAKIEAEKEDRKVRDGEIKTACQQACPADAIVFGDVNDPESRVAKMKADPRNYSMLAQLNTKPRTTYLARVGNPNPELVKLTSGAADHGSEHGEG